jgi:hypothetical protein
MIFADLIAKWRQLDAESERVNAFPDLSVEVKDAVEGLAFEAFTEIRDTPATNMDELLYKLRFAAEHYEGDNEDGGAQGAFFCAILEDVKRLTKD